MMVLIAIPMIQMKVIQIQPILLKMLVIL